MSEKTDTIYYSNSLLKQKYWPSWEMALTLKVANIYRALTMHCTYMHCSVDLIVYNTIQHVLLSSFYRLERQVWSGFPMTKITSVNL